MSNLSKLLTYLLLVPVLAAVLGMFWRIEAHERYWGPVRVPMEEYYALLPPVPSVPPPAWERKVKEFCHEQGFDYGFGREKNNTVVVYNRTRLGQGPAAAVLSLEDGHLLYPLNMTPSPGCGRARSVKLSPDEKLIWLKDSDGCPASMVDLNSGRELWQGQNVGDLFTPDSRFLLGNQGPNMPLIDTKTGKMIRDVAYPWPEAQDANIVFSTDSRFVYFGLGKEAWKSRLW